MFLRPGGYAKVEGQDVGRISLDHGRKFICDGNLAEFDSFTCFHCNTVVHVPAKCRPEDIGGMCKICMNLICPKCLDKGCVPFEEKLKAWAARTAALRSYGL